MRYTLWQGGTLPKRSGPPKPAISETLADCAASVAERVTARKYVRQIRHTARKHSRIFVKLNSLQFVSRYHRAIGKVAGSLVASDLQPYIPAPFRHLHDCCLHRAAQVRVRTR